MIANPVPAVPTDWGGSIADTDVRDHYGMTPLHHASIRGHQNVLLLLLHAEADINAVTSNGDTPLILVSNMCAYCIYLLTVKWWVPSL